MMEIRTVPDPILRQVCQPVVSFGTSLATLAEQMRETMAAYQGIGLAAPQVGELLRLVVVRVDGDAIAIANPVLICGRGSSHLDEGCLSCPGVLVRVRRSARVLVSGRNCDGAPVSYRVDQVEAHCIQHEIDHLDGRLILDHGPALDRSAGIGQSR